MALPKNCGLNPKRFWFWEGLPWGPLRPPNLPLTVGCINSTPDCTPWIVLAIPTLRPIPLLFLQHTDMMLNSFTELGLGAKISNDSDSSSNSNSAVCKMSYYPSPAPRGVPPSLQTALVGCTLQVLRWGLLFCVAYFSTHVQMLYNWKLSMAFSCWSIILF